MNATIGSYFLGGKYHGRYGGFDANSQINKEFKECYWQYYLVYNSTVIDDDLDGLNVELHNSLDRDSALLALLSVDLPEEIRQRFEQDILKHYA